MRNELPPLPIDIETEEKLTLARAALLPTLKVNGRSPDKTTVWRWAMRGVRGVRLQTVTVGGTTCTTEAAVLRFIERLNTSPGQAPAMTAAVRRRQLEHADAVLSGAGI